MAKKKYELQELNESLNNKVLPFLMPINDFIRNKFYTHTVVPDNVWGQIHLFPWETALVDTLLMQRLRQIHQLGIAFFVYPSALHDRFTHSLGVSYLAESLIQKLETRIKQKKVYAEEAPNQEIISAKDIYTVKLAGLLHDVGHCMFSHYSEVALKPYLDSAYYQVQDDIPNRPSTHEFMGYLILKSDYFKKYWDEILLPIFARWNVPDKDIPSLSDMAKIITGNFISDDKTFLTEIINGPYDMDKLEYLKKDSLTAGMSMSYDKDRYLSTLILHKQKNDAGKNVWRLAMKQDGVHTAEQMIIGKMLLFPYVFQHNKVLASGFLLSRIIEKLLQGKTTNNIKIKNPCELLLYTDYDLLCLSCTSKNPALKQQLDDFRNRNFPKVAFAFNKDFCLNNPNDKKFIKNLQVFGKQVSDKHKKLVKQIADFICKQAESKGIKSVSGDLEIACSITKNTVDTMANAPIVSYTEKMERVKDRWLMKNWDKGFSNVSDTIYFYVPVTHMDIAFDAIGMFLAEHFDFKIDLDKVRDTVKLKKEK